MTTPRGIFIDTCVFERQHFDFSTTAITSFAKIADELDLKLLVPRATEHEITKHLKAKARDALQGLQKTARTAPFLKGGSSYRPASGTTRLLPRLNVKR